MATVSFLSLKRQFYNRMDSKGSWLGLAAPRQSSVDGICLGNCLIHDGLRCLKMIFFKQLVFNRFGRDKRANHWFQEQPLSFVAPLQLALN